MNDIKLNKPILLNKRYVIYLDAENKFSFKDKRKANDFITLINHEIDKAVLFITEEFNVLTEWTRLFNLTEKDYKFRYQIKQSQDLISNRLDYIGTHGLSINYDSLIFSAVLSCLDELVHGFGLLAQKSIRRKDTLTKRRSALKIEIIKAFQDRFLGLGIKPNKQASPLAVVYKVS